MTAGPIFQLLGRYRLHLSFFLFVAVVLEWQLDDGGRPHALLSVADSEHVLGMLLIAAGLFLRSWAAGIIDKRAALATAGPYALVRHPLYVGSFLIALGLAASMEDPLALFLVALALPLIYAVTIRNKERLMAERFGPMWTRYAERTGAVVPRLSPTYRHGTWSFERWRHNHEWRILFRTVVVLGLLEWWNLARGGL